MTDSSEPALADEPAKRDVVFAYHERTKHHFHRFARSLGFMDWANQPNPFRCYEGAAHTHLDVSRQPQRLPYRLLYEHNSAPAQPLNLNSLADFFRYSLALSAWKQAGAARWALRINPSSGNLHPTEAYVLLPPLSEFSHAPALCHYVSQSHALELRASLSHEVWEHLLSSLPDGSFLLGLTSILWREAWKYGERAFRYCQHDIGHALAALSFSAVLCGWDVRLVQGWSTADVSVLLGLDRAGDFLHEEREEAELLCVVGPNLASKEAPIALPSLVDGIRDEIRAAAWYGKPNRLSKDHVTWPVIDEVTDATAMPRQMHLTKFRFNVIDRRVGDSQDSDARSLILQRRSCLGLDGRSQIPLTTFLRMMSRTLPRAHPPWDKLSCGPHIHFVLFVHRVRGLSHGMYAFVRDSARLEALQRATRSDFAWQTPPDVDTGFPLYLLRESDCREVARALSCHQDIAADGFFSLGMLAEFADPIHRNGAHFYRNLFWEAGVVGQVLYLEAEAAGARSTGIGCFFDDAVHEVLGLSDNRFQSLYHFTVGMPIEDDRLQSWPPYGSQVVPSDP